MNEAKITAVIPTYHRPDLLARAIKSVQMQSFEDWECIVFSDHCPKAHLVYENYFSGDARVRFVENPNEWKKNVGAVGVNYAIRNARSNIITYLCDDNVFLPNHFDVMYHNLCDDWSGGTEHVGHQISGKECKHADVVETENYLIKIGEGDGKIKEILDRGFYSDIAKTHQISPYADMLRLGHKIDSRWHGGLIDRIYWKAQYELEGNTSGDAANEDGHFIKELKMKSRGWVKTPEVTAIYYARGAYRTRDEDYHNRVMSLKSDDIFVYPEIMKEILD